MAFVIATKRGTFEVRESRSTPKGPRSRTLATFSELTEEAIGKARARAEKPLDPAELRAAAARVGAPIAGEPVDDSARKTLRLMAAGHRLDPMLRRLLLDTLAPQEPTDRRTASSATVSDAARAATQWIGASLAQRGEALRDLLLLSDALPVHFRDEEIEFPRLRSV
jgi:hypothetical protein